MAGKYNTWLRTKLADRIRDNGGYCGRGGHYALVWMVRVYTLGIDGPDEAAAALVEHEHFVNETDLNLQFPDFKAWFSGESSFSTQGMYDSAIEALQNDLSDDDGFRMWSPETAARYGFDYKGEGADKPFIMELLGVSSGGKRVALTSFDGVELAAGNMSSEDLADWIEHPDWTIESTVSNIWCRKLMGIMDELDEALTEENAKRCGRYYATDYIARELGLFD